MKNIKKINTELAASEKEGGKTDKYNNIIVLYIYIFIDKCPSFGDKYRGKNII